MVMFIFTQILVYNYRTIMLYSLYVDIQCVHSSINIIRGIIFIFQLTYLAVLLSRRRYIAENFIFLVIHNQPAYIRKF